jgi:hypothetical protein
MIQYSHISAFGLLSGAGVDSGFAESSRSTVASLAIRASNVTALGSNSAEIGSEAAEDRGRFLLLSNSSSSAAYRRARPRPGGIGSGYGGTSGNSTVANLMIIDEQISATGSLRPGSGPAIPARGRRRSPTAGSGAAA